MNPFRRIWVWSSLGVVLGLLNSNAATKVWTGAKDGLWSNPANWKDGQIPTDMDSLEFPADGIIRETTNDMIGPGYGSITFSGGNYTIKGYHVQLTDGIVTLPGNCTNRIECNIFAKGSQTFSCAGYFNQLDIAGTVQVPFGLRLDSAYDIRVSGEILVTTTNAYIVKGLGGKLSFGPNGAVGGPLTIEEGTMDLSSPSASRNFGGTLIIGEEGQAPNLARVIVGGVNKMSPSAVTINQSGALYLNGYDLALNSLNGDGVVDLGGATLSVTQQAINQPITPANFSGELRGAGTFRVAGFESGQELSGQNTFTGSVQVTSAFFVTNFFTMTGTDVPGRLILSGGANNADVVVWNQSTLSGNGTARSLTTTNAIIAPGPGALHVLNACRLDPDSELDLTLGTGTDSQLQAATFDAAGAALHLDYQGPVSPGQFTIVTTYSGPIVSTFSDLPEGAWFVTGDPTASTEFQITYVANGGYNVVLNSTGLYVPPALGIQTLPGGGRLIEWPLSAQGYTLEQTPDLSMLAWTNRGLPLPATNATDHFVIDTNSVAARFYRLKR